MSSRKTLILIAAIGIGVLAGFALLNYVRGIERDVYDDAQPVEVLIATADIPQGTAVSDAFASIEVTEVPLKIRPATFVSPDNTDPITGLVAQSDIPQNQIIVSGLFVDPSVVSQSLRDQIPTGMVAFSLDVEMTRAVGGYLQPGDEVNVLVNHVVECGADEPAAEGETPLDTEAAATTNDNSFGASVTEAGYCTYTQPARYLYQRVEVLAIGDSQAVPTGDEETTEPPPLAGGTITLLVPNEAAQLLASVAPEDVYLTLLPDGYEVEPLPALSTELQSNRTPAEIPGCASPYGPEGFIEGDSAAVAEGEDATDYVRGHCVPLWAENGE